MLAFLNDRISFVDIPRLLEMAVENHPWLEAPDIEDLGHIAEWTAKYLEERISAN